MLYPEQQELHQYVRDEKNIGTYGTADTLDGGTLFPGLIVSVGELFAEPEE